MPTIVAFFIRNLIIIGVQLGIFAFAESVVVPLLNRAITEIMAVFGVNKETASDILHNEVITTIEALGLTALFAKAKLPLKIVDTLGLTTKGFSKRKLSTEVQKKIDIIKKAAPAAAAGEAKIITDVAVVAGEAKGILPSKVKDLMAVVGFVVGLPTAMMYMVAQYIDFGTWSGSAYQDTFQKILAVFGLHPDQPMRSSKILSKEQWQKIYNTYKEIGAVGINDPYKNQSVLFSTDNLIDLVDKVAAHLLAETGTASAKQVIGATQALIILREPLKTIAPKAIPTTAQEVAKIPQIKVFTGIIKQGKISDAPAFVPREDDLIDDYNELQTAIENNIPPFIAALPSRLIYELKIVPNITTKDGFTRYGTTQQIIKSYRKDGSPILKTIVNKFAVVNMYVFTARGVKTKIDTIILGPVDSVQLQIGKEAENQINMNLRENITTRETSQIKTIETTEIISIERPKIDLPAVAPEMIATPPTAPDDPQDTQAIAYRGKYYEHNTFREIARPRFGYLVGMPETGSIEMRASASGLKKEYVERFLNAIKEVITPEIEKAKITTIAAASPVVTTPEKAAAMVATNLSEFYARQKQSLPTVSERAKIYERFFVGQGNWYMGTADQNNKLLNALKAEL